DEQRKWLCRLIPGIIEYKLDVLDDIVDSYLGQRLETITQKTALNEIVSELVTWANKHHKVDYLIYGLWEAKPNSPELQSFVKSISTNTIWSQLANSPLARIAALLSFVFAIL